MHRAAAHCARMRRAERRVGGKPIGVFQKLREPMRYELVQVNANGATLTPSLGNHMQLSFISFQKTNMADQRTEIIVWIPMPSPKFK
jgi:hypothetical protein